MDVFVYGTLAAPEQVGAVVDAFAFVGAARLEGLDLVEGHYPTLVPGGTTGGRLLRTDDVAALDAYEGVDRGLYVRVSVPLVGGGDHPDEAALYVGDPERLEADGTWPGTGSFAERVDAYLDANDVRVVVDGEGR